MIGNSLRRAVLVAVTAAAALAALAAAACGGGAAGASSSAGGSAAPAPSARRDRAVITTQDLAESQASNLYDVVQRLHPEWLAGRNAATITNAAAGDVQVYLDSQRMGGSTMLRQMAVNSAASLHFYSASESQSRFGNGNANGVIQVVTVNKR